mgnify:CR=1 FL=1
MREVGIHSQNKQKTNKQTQSPKSQQIQHHEIINGTN